MRKYIGIPYKELGRTVDGVDCWGFVCLYYKDTYGIDLPHYNYGSSTAEHAMLIDEQKENWSPDEDGELVLLRQFKLPSHVGIVKGDRFYHCEEGTGVVSHKLNDPRWRHRIVARFAYKGAQVVACPSLISDRRDIVVVPEGATLQDIVDHTVDKKWHCYVYVAVHGQPVLPELWENTRVKSGAMVTIRVIPKGGGKGILRAILTIAVMVWAGGAGGRLFSNILNVSKATGSAIAGAVGLLVVSALVPPPVPRLNGLSDIEQSNVYSIQGAQNRVMPYSSVPVVLGTNRIYPPYAAKPYTQIVGDNQYLCCLFAVGYGPLTISDIKIGDTAIDSFSDVEYETREGTAGDAAITLFPESVTEDQISVELTSVGSWQERTTPADTDEVGVDITFPQGLVRYTDTGGTASWKNLVEINYREDGDTGAWTNPLGQSIQAVAVATGGSGATPKAPIIVTGGGGTGLAGYVLTNPFGTGVRSVVITHVGTGYTSTPTITVSGSTATFTPAMGDGYLFEETSTQPVRHGFRFALPSRGTWDIRCKKSSVEQISPSIVEAMYWTAIRSIKNEVPVSTPYHLAKIAVRIKATGQLNGIISTLSCIASSRVTSWDGAAWQADTASRNPADIYRYLLQGPFNSSAVADARIDLTSLAAWSVFCDTQGYSFDAVLDSKDTLANRLASVAAVGRATFAMSDNKYSIVIDDTQTTPIQLIGPGNTKSFSYSRTFVTMPHAFRCRFINRDNDYLQEERIVYADGYTALNATLFEQLELFGVTDPDHVWKLARYFLAVAANRQQSYIVEMDAEHLVCTRGDLVQFQHDVIQYGISGGRILEKNANWIRVNNNCPMEAGKSYAVNVRKSNGTVEYKTVTLNVGDNLILQGSGFTCAAGDVFHFGIAGAVDVDCLVQKIEPMEDLAARLTLIPYVAGVYTADSGAIPAYTNQATLPDGGLFPTAPTNLTANELLYKDSGNLYQGVDLQWYHSDDTVVDYYEIQMLRPDATSGYEVVGTSTLPRFRIRDIPAGDYSFRVKAVVGLRGSNWLTLADETIDAYNDVPDSVTGIRIVYRGGTPWIVWTAVDDIRPVRYELRILRGSALSWSQGIQIGTTANPEWNPQVKGYYYVKAVYADAESATAAQVYVPFSALDSENVKKSKTETWSGTLSGSVFPNPPLVGAFSSEWNNYINGFDGTYDTTYDGSAKPNDDGWTLSGTDVGSVAGGVLTIAEGAECFYYKTIAGLTGNQFVTVSARLKVDEGDEATIFIMNNGLTAVTALSIQFDRIVLGAQDTQEIECDMSSDFRTIKIEMRESMKVFLDGELLLVKDCLGSAAAWNRMWFGRYWSASTLSGAQYWTEVDFAVDTMTLDNTPHGTAAWTKIGTTSITTDWSTQSDYGYWTGNGTFGWKKTPVMTAADVTILSVPLFNLVESAVVSHYLSINNTASGYGIKVRQTNGTWYAESTDGATAIDDTTFTDSDELICTLILDGSKFWFLINRTLVMSGTAEADSGALGDDIRFAGVTTSNVFIAGIEGAYLYHGTTYPNGLCLLPGDTGVYTIDAADQVDLGYSAQSVIDSEFQASIVGIYDLLVVDDLLLEPDLLTGSTQNIQANYAAAQISLDSDTFTPLVPGSYYAQTYNLRINMAAPDNERLYITAWDWEIDMPDRLDLQQVTSLTTGDLAVTYDPAFQATPKIQVSIMDEQAGDHVEVTSETVSGFTLNVYNSASRVARVVNISAQGY